MVSKTSKNRKRCYTLLARITCTLFHFSAFQQMCSITRHENGMRVWSYIAQNTDQLLAATSEHVHYQPTNNHKAEKGSK